MWRKTPYASMAEWIAQPDWSPIEGELGFAVPSALRQFYSDLNLIQRQNVEIADTVGSVWNLRHFDPPDGDPIGLDWIAAPRFSFALASTVHGGVVFAQLDLNSRQPNSVWGIRAVGDAAVVISDSISRFHALALKATKLGSAIGG